MIPCKECKETFYESYIDDAQGDGLYECEACSAFVCSECIVQCPVSIKGYSTLYEVPVCHGNNSVSHNQCDGDGKGLDECMCIKDSCKNTVCIGHSILCGDCDGVTCAQCLLICEDCIPSFCHDCATYCWACERYFCISAHKDDHGEECDLRCEFCVPPLPYDYATYCGFCLVWYCPDHKTTPKEHAKCE